jgi:hypothetical protein
MPQSSAYGSSCAKVNGGQLNLGAIGPAAQNAIKMINPLATGGRRRR